MKYRLFVLTFLFSAVGWAQTSSLRAYLLNPEMRFERANSQEMMDRRPLNIALGYQKEKFSILAEYARFEEDTGNATSSLDRTHQDVVVWFRYHFLNRIDKQSLSTTTLFAGAGAGAYEEQVVTTLMGVSRTDKTPTKFMSGFVVGAEFSILMNPHFGFVFGAEGRGLLASDFDPNPVWSALLRLGIQAPL
ncbi:hypothetical protein [Bdellovibrio sp.]|uniref:hypothetical protein n=1 Tax=Bdellovibrio sp. TaxID=28201 RepID=UPI0039E2A6C2